MMVLKTLFILLIGLVIRIPDAYPLMSSAAWGLFIFSLVWVESDRSTASYVFLSGTLSYIAIFHGIMYLGWPGV